MKQSSAHRIVRRVLSVSALGLVMIMTSSALAQAAYSCMVDTIRLRIITGTDDLRGGQDNLNVSVRWGTNGFQGAPNVNKNVNWPNGSENTVELKLKQPVALNDIKSITLDHLANGGLTVSTTTVLSPIGVLAGLQTQDNWDMASLEVNAVGPGVGVIIARNGEKRFTGSDPVLTVRPDLPPNACPSSSSQAIVKATSTATTATIKPTSPGAIASNPGTSSTKQPVKLAQQQINAILAKVHSTKGTPSPVVVSPGPINNSSTVATLAQQKQVALTERSQGAPAASAPSGTIQTAAIAPVSAIRGPAPAAAASAPSTTVNRLAAAPASSITVACSTLHTPSITTVSGQQGSSAVFTQDPQYNLFTIRGCNFGQNKGQLQLNSSSGQTFTNMTIDSWTDTLITAEVPTSLLGVADQDNVSLVLIPSGGSQIDKSGFHFYAKRGELHLTSIPASIATLAPISDDSGSPVMTKFSSPYVFISITGNVSAPGGVDRINGVRFPGGTDVFDFSKLKPGFSIEKFQVSQLSTPMCAGGGDNYTDGNWNSQLTGNTIRVTWQEVHCHLGGLIAVDSVDASDASYGLDVWLVGPVLGPGDSPWQDGVK